MAVAKREATATRKEFLQAVELYGATIQEIDEGRGFGICVDAPRRKVWMSDGVHCLRSEVPYLWKGAKAEVYADLIDRMEYGLEDCEEKDCDYCEGY